MAKYQFFSVFSKSPDPRPQSSPKKSCHPFSDLQQNNLIDKDIQRENPRIRGDICRHLDRQHGIHPLRYHRHGSDFLVRPAPAWNRTVGGSQGTEKCRRDEFDAVEKDADRGHEFAARDDVVGAPEEGFEVVGLARADAA